MGTQTLSAALRAGDSPLKTLNLDENAMTAVGAGSLAGAFGRSGLKGFSFGGNPIGPAGAMAFAQSMGGRAFKFSRMWADAG
ncbi:MAG: hypothetical protein FJX18_00915 [Alphaproteobacteria bacterium]|nr:hypothetical protein [Alphaproteobacteria bacterium]